MLNVAQEIDISYYESGKHGSLLCAFHILKPLMNVCGRQEGIILKKCSWDRQGNPERPISGS